MKFFEKFINRKDASTEDKDFACNILGNYYFGKYYTANNTSDLDEGLKYYLQITDLDSSTCMTIGYRYMHLKNWKEALDYFNKILAGQRTEDINFQIGIAEGNLPRSLEPPIRISPPTDD